MLDEYNQFPIKIIVEAPRGCGKTLLAGKLYTMLKRLGYVDVSYKSYSNTQELDFIKQMPLPDYALENDLPNRKIIIEDR